MELKLERIIYPIILLVITLVFVGITLFNSIADNTTNEQEWDNFLNRSKQNVQNNTTAICSALQTIQPAVTTVITNIHKELVKKNRHKTKYNTSRFYVDDISYYQNYRYNYILFSHIADNTTDIVENYSSIANSNFHNFIISAYLGMLNKKADIFSSLSMGQVVYKLISYENVIYIFSGKFIIDNRGKITGSVVVIMTLNEFIKLRDFILEDDNTNVFICDNDCNIIYGNELNGKYDIMQALMPKSRSLLRKNELVPDMQAQHYSDNKLNKKILHSTGYNQLFGTTILSYAMYDNPKEKQVVSTKIIIFYVCIIVAILLLIRLVIWRSNILVNKVLRLFYSVQTTDSVLNEKYLEQKINKVAKSKILWKDYSRYRKQLDNIIKRKNNGIKTEIQCKQQAKILNELEEICNNLMHCMDNSKLDNAVENVSQAQSNIVVIERIVKDSNLQLQALKTLADSNKNMEVSANLLEINFAIVVNQLNDSRIKELFAMLKSHNWTFRENNELLQNGIAFSTNYDSIFSLLIQIQKNLDLILSAQKSNNEAHSAFKNKLDNLFYNKKLD